jgi:hypothetical protein
MWGCRGVAPPLLTSALDGGEWLASCPGRFIPGEIVAGTHWTGGCVKYFNKSLTKYRRFFNNNLKLLWIFFTEIYSIHMALPECIVAMFSGGCIYTGRYIY